MAFRKKWHLMLALKPDILVVQECEHESKYKSAQLIPGYNEFIWMGTNINKGIGIITFNNYHVEVMADYSEEFRFVIPMHVSGHNNFNLFAIWAMPDKKKRNGYIGQTWRAINHYKHHLDEPSILVGDLNSNAYWDHERKIGNHTQTVEQLQRHSIVSTYHSIREESHGQETEPTLYFTKKQEKPYHLDYCFSSSEMIGRNTEVEIGKFQDWIKFSDHMPIVVDNIGM